MNQALDLPTYLRAASPAVLAAWHMLDAEDELALAAPPPRARPRAAARPWPRLSRRLVPALLLPAAVLVLAGLALLASPLRAARQLQQALVTAEPGGLEALADWDRLRANLTARMLPPGEASPYLEDLAMVVATGLASPEGLRQALREPAAGAAPLPRPGSDGLWRLTLEDPLANPAPGGVELALARHEGRWRMVDLSLPAPPEAGHD